MTTHRHRQRTGSVAILSLILMVTMLAFVAFGVDVGYMLVTRTELQRSADSSAVASTWHLIQELDLEDKPGTRAVADGYVAMNKSGHLTQALSTDDVQIGRIADPANPAAPMTFDNPLRFNAVQIRVQRTAAQNGELPLFFARVMGINTAGIDAQATSAFYDNIRGFRVPQGPGKRTLGILPIALDEPTWDTMLAAKPGEVSANLFPMGDGPPGNRGTVDIGSASNSTADIERQIVDGVSPADLAYHPGGILCLGPGGLELNGDTGISAGVKDELWSIRNTPRMIPIFDEVNNPGNNAMYNIVEWGCVIITEVRLTGAMNKKTVTIQRSKMFTKGAIPAEPGDEQVSTGIYSYPQLIR